MSEPMSNECACTEFEDCASCRRLDDIGRKWFDVNGETALGRLLEEIDRLRAHVQGLEREMFKVETECFDLKLFAKADRERIAKLEAQAKADEKAMRKAWDRGVLAIANGHDATLFSDAHYILDMRLAAREKP